jgi:glyoxylase-like metal-dependent hydrolase (beta-lactamase superfamily II)
MRTTRRVMLTGAAAAGVAMALDGPARAAAPMQEAAPGGIHRYKVGGFEITALLDSARVSEKPETIFGTDQKPEDVAALLAANFLPADKLVNMFTPLLVNTGKELVLIDTGLGAANGGQVMQRIAEAGYAPEQIDLVVITHGHPDHIGGLAAEGKPAFSKARYAVGEAEYAFWSAPERQAGPTEGPAKLFTANVVPFRERMSFLKDGTEVVPGLRAVSAPGHTPGHMAFHLESDGKRLLIGADFCNHYVLSLQRPDWDVKFDADKATAAKTRKALLDMIATDRIAFTSYHMPFPSVGFVEKSSEGYRFVPATYQMML